MAKFMVTLTKSVNVLVEAEDEETVWQWAQETTPDEAEEKAIQEVYKSNPPKRGEWSVHYDEHVEESPISGAAVISLKGEE